jgi:hypothetical protein
MYTAYDKAIAAAVIAIVGLLALIFHWSVPGWLTETNIMQVLVVVTPIVVGLIPNKATAAQKVEVLTNAGVIPPATPK